MNVPKTLQVPSGQTYDADDLALLNTAAQARFVEHRDKPFTLASKVESNVYVHGRGETTDQPILLMMVGKKIVRSVWTHSLLSDHQPNLIGLPTVGTGFAVAASVASTMMRPRMGPLIACRVMREQRKSHGDVQRWVNGDPPDLNKFTYWSIDNVVTNAKTKFEAAEHFEEDGYASKEMPQLIFIDRQQGGVHRLEAAGFKRIVVCYNLLDITYTFGELGLWPKGAVQQVENEIKAHQFL